MVNNTKFRTGPKRLVQRTESILNSVIPNSSTPKVLLTVDEKATLVRSILQLDVAPISGGTLPASYNLTLTREPSGVQLVTPATTENLDNELTKNTLWSWNGHFPAVELHSHIDVDLSSMRKLDVGDEIVLRVISDEASSVQLTGVVTLFTKLA